MNQGTLKRLYLLFFLLASQQARGDNCGSLSDCYDTILAAVAVAVVIAAIIALIIYMPEILAALGIGATEAGEGVMLAGEAAEAIEAAVAAEAATAAEAIEAATLAAEAAETATAIAESAEMAEASSAATAAAEAAEASAINAVRTELGVSQGRNIAYATARIGETAERFLGVSGQAARSGTVGVPESRFFQTITTGQNSRMFDSEVKILEEIASRYANNPNVQGTVRLVSERVPCVSCSGVIEQFQAMFPNIRVIVSHVL